MAAKQQAGAKRRKSTKKAMKKTMNQFATTARRKTKKLRNEAETAVESAGEWVGDKASMVGDRIKRQPLLMGVFAAAIGTIGWFMGRRSSSSK